MNTPKQYAYLPESARTIDFAGAEICHVGGMLP
jgi:hypothetical protein